MTYAGRTYAGEPYAVQRATSATGLPLMVASFTGTSTPPVFNTVLAASLPAATVQLSGASTNANGVLNGTLPTVMTQITGISVPPFISGPLQASLRALTSTLGGNVTAPPPVTAALNGWLPPFAASMRGQVREPTGQHRWTLHDPTTNETYVFPLNPNKMTTPHSPRNFHIIATAPSGVHTGGSRAGMGRVVELAREPFEWTFSGRIKTEGHYDELLAWSDKLHKVQVSDHFGRIWSVRILAFNPNELIPTPRVSWRYEYDFKVLNYGEVT